MCNVFSILQNSARLYPDKAYVVDKGIGLTYSEIYNQSVVLANIFNEAGVKNGDRVLIYLDNSAEYIAAYFGVLLVN